MSNTILSSVYTHLENEHYEDAISNCGRIIEQGLKDQYFSTKNFVVLRSGIEEWKRLLIPADREFESKFIERTAGMGGYIRFFKSTRLWDLVRKIKDSNLYYLKLIDWHSVRKLRNKAAHGEKINREEALEMFWFTKIFAIELGLIEGVFTHQGPIHINENHNCANCNSDLEAGWIFCPKCGAHTTSSCNNCGRELKSDHNICPSCNTIRKTPMLNKDTLKDNLRMYKAFCTAIFIDNEITPLERKFLDEKRLEFAISPDQAAELESEGVPEGISIFNEISKMALRDGKLDKMEIEYLYLKAKELNVQKEIVDNFVKSYKNNKRNNKGGWTFLF